MSQTDKPDFQIYPYPRSRILIVDAVRAGSRKHLIHGLIEMDVTDARERLRTHRDRTGESFSFTAFILHCLGQAIDEHKMIHACRDWRGRLVVFDEVDVNTIIEVDVEDHHFPLAHTVRAVNRRPLRDLHEEIRRAQTGADRTYNQDTQDLARLYTRLPTFIRDLAFRVVMKNPQWMKQIGGTVSVTAVGMFGEGGGWGIPIPLYSICVTLGGISSRAAVVDKDIVPREILDVTLTFDHDVVDGAPAARFAGRFKELVETSCGLDAALEIPLPETGPRDSTS